MRVTSEHPLRSSTQPTHETLNKSLISRGKSASNNWHVAFSNLTLCPHLRVVFEVRSDSTQVCKHTALSEQGADR